MRRPLLQRKHKWKQQFRERKTRKPKSYLIRQSFYVTIANQALPLLHGRSLEIALTVLLRFRDKKDYVSDQNLGASKTNNLRNTDLFTIVVDNFCIFVLLYYCITVLLYHSIVVLLFYCIIVLLYYRIIILSCYLIIILSYYRITVLLYYRIIVLL